MLIRNATPADIPAIIALEKQTPELAHWPEETYTAAFEPEAPDRIFLVSETAGVVCGFLIARPTAPECELESIAVAQASRRRGIASQLLDALIAAARDRGAEKIWLEVRESNASARSFYKKIGFQETGTRKNYYSDPVESAVVESLALVLVQKS